MGEEGDRERETSSCLPNFLHSLDGLPVGDVRQRAALAFVVGNVFL